MKWIGWDYEQYLEAPTDLTDRIIEFIQAENEKYAEMRKGREAKTSPFHAERDKSGKVRIVADKEQAPAAASTTVDPNTGRTMVTKVKDDGTTVTHREIAPGESLIHSMFGKPKSWQNK